MPNTTDQDLVLADLPMDAVLVPATSAQRGMWFAGALDGGTAAYHVGQAFRVTGELDLGAFAAAFAALLRQHELLRTGFGTLDGELYQVVHPETSAVITRLPLDGPDSVAAALAQPFDVRTPPLLRLCLCRAEGDAAPVLVVLAHHLIADGRSMDLLLTELALRYDAELGAGEVEPPSPQLAYADYATWEADWIETADCGRHIEFFRGLLAGAPAAIDLPLPRRPAADRRGGTEFVALSTDTSDGLARLARSAGATLFIAGLTLFAGVLHRWADQPTVVVGVPASLRDQPELTGMIGMLVNSVALPTHWDDDPPFAVALARVRDTVADSLAWRRCPFDHLVRELRPPRDGQRNPLFQVYCSYEAGSPPRPSLRGVELTPLDVPGATAKFDLTLDLVDRGGTLVGALEWSAQWFDPETAALFGAHLAAAADQVVADPELPVGRWDLGAPAGQPLLAGAGDRLGDAWEQVP